MDETAGDPRDPEGMVKAFLQYKIMEQMHAANRERHTP